jgi:ribonuclease Z
MRPSFYPRLVNDPFGDPGLFIPFFFKHRAVMFDLGDIHALSARDILKTSHVFTTHAHMDHFIGFDHMLRLFLGRDKTLYIYGPEGILKNIEGKLAGYEWNLVGNFSYQLVLHVTEVHKDHLSIRTYKCRDRFGASEKIEHQSFSGVLLEKPDLTVTATILDHGIPCLGLMIKERFHININKERVNDMGLDIGPWLADFKQSLFRGMDPNDAFEVISGKNPPKRKRFPLGELAKKIAIITPGQKVAYITDVKYSEQNVEKIIEIAENADHLFIEASFLEMDREIAEKKCHLTARQAGHIAGKAGVKQFTVFHFSPRYTGMGHLLQEEAMKAFEEARNH